MIVVSPPPDSFQAIIAITAIIAIIAIITIIAILAIIAIGVSSRKLIPAPRFLPLGYSLSSCALPRVFFGGGEILKSGVGITFCVPMMIIMIAIELIIILTNAKNPQDTKHHS